MSTKLPRVSEILRAVGLAPDFSAVPEPVLAAARERGTARHAAIEADHYGYVEPAQEPLLGGYRRFLADTGHVPEVSEGLVCHKTWGYVGHPDRIGQTPSLSLVIVEWKPMGTNRVAASYQLAAYARAWESMGKPAITHGYVVELDDDTYRMTDVTQPDPSGKWPGLDAAWVTFQAAIHVYRAQQGMRPILPRAWWRSSAPGTPSG